jgi:hypothetical protein
VIKRSLRVESGEALMNPFAWRKEHQVAIIVGAILGAVILEVIGLMYRDLHYATMSGFFWTGSTVRWAILGALIGAGIVYVRRLLQT